jgi:hypothetical protein
MSKPDCLDCRRPWQQHLPDSGKFACPTQSMNTKVPIRYYRESTQSTPPAAAKCPYCGRTDGGCSCAMRKVDLYDFGETPPAGRMSFERFLRGRHINTRSLQSTICIGKQVRVSFSKPCSAWLLSRGDFVELLFDKESRSIAFLPVNKDDANAYKLHHRSDGERGTFQCYISCRTFLQWAGSPPNGTYEAKMEEESGMLTVFIGASSGDSSAIQTSTTSKTIDPRLGRG